MRRLVGCLVLCCLLFAGIYFAGWWFQSPRLDWRTPAKQGDLFLRRVFLVSEKGKLTYPDADFLLLEFEALSDFPYGEIPLRIVTSSGVTERLTAWINMWSGNAYSYEYRLPSLWERLWANIITSHIGKNTSTDKPYEARIYVTYPASVRYMDIYVDLPEYSNTRWRLTNLPRSSRVIPQPVRVVDRYRCEHFEIRASAVQLPAEPGSSTVTVWLDIRVTQPPSPDHELNVKVTSFVPEWIRGAEFGADPTGAFRNFIVTGSGRYMLHVDVPFLPYQRYLRLNFRALLVGYHTERRVLKMPVQRVVQRDGASWLVIARDQELAVSMLAGNIIIPPAKDVPEVVDRFLFPINDNRIVLACWTDIEDTSDWGPEICKYIRTKLDIGVALPPSYKKRKMHTVDDFLNARFVFVEQPLDQPIPPEVLVTFRGRGVSWCGNVHQFSLTLPLARER
ncbi:MAG: hypothetical protein RMM08_01975 [Armatimonadota bacterium]|nr:hypothetical protein [Armatimonadota bacterium]